jgi:hypothetical protein
MGLLFLDPLVLVAIGTVLVGCWFVWRGLLRSWFGRPGAWTALVWPLPLVLVVTPLLVVPLRGALAIGLDVSGLELGDTADASVFAGLYLVPLIGLTLWPPQWLLPRWARARLGVPAPPDPSEPAGNEDRPTSIVMPACLGRRGHGSRARWVWRVDAVSGVLSIADGQVRFRPDPPPGTSLPTGDLGEPPTAVRPSSADDPDHHGTRIETTWGRRYLDADLAVIDDVRIHARRWWADDGVLTLELAGRPSAHLWVTDVARLQDVLATMR